VLTYNFYCVSANVVTTIDVLGISKKIQARSKINDAFNGETAAGGCKIPI
jgi:hypothetical protein